MTLTKSHSIVELRKQIRRQNHIIFVLTTLLMAAVIGAGILLESGTC